MDGYGGYPSGYPPGAGPGYNEPPPMQRPPSQSNSQSPHSGKKNLFLFIYNFHIKLIFNHLLFIFLHNFCIKLLLFKKLLTFIHIIENVSKIIIYIN